MRLCAYWDCMEEVDEGMSFCREHGKKLNRQLIDKCPKCGRYKDVRQDTCPDCRYGRPVADWKVASRNLEDAEYNEPVQESRPNIPPESIPARGFDKRGASMFVRGEALCPSCGSPDLTYKSVFEYFRCNNCETTFITPVYSYGETRQKAGGLESSQAISNQLFNETRAEPRPVVRQEPVMPVNQPVVRQPVQMESTMDVVNRQREEDRALSFRALRMRGQGGSLGWVYLVIVICIIALIALLCWLLFNEQIGSFLNGLF